VTPAIRNLSCDLARFLPLTARSMRYAVEELIRMQKELAPGARASSGDAGIRPGWFT